MRLLVGLGNVGTRYRDTRHNAGFMVVDQIARTFDASWKTESKLKANVAVFEINGEKILLAKPSTMMNLSGEATQRIMQSYKLTPKDVWVIFDDVDTPFGRLRVRQGGGSSGHQGINSMVSNIGPNFIRVKFGISLNDRTVEPSEVYVLKTFNTEEQLILPAYIERAAEFVIDLSSHDTVTAESFELGTK